MCFAKRIITASAASLCSLLFAFLLMQPRLTVAQTVTGSITGTVTDASGAVVAGADVTARNVHTGVEARPKPILRASTASGFCRSGSMR